MPQILGLMRKSKIIVAIDGYSSCGKSTLSKQLANALKYSYVDTGAMYRAVTLYALKNKLIVDGIINKKSLIEQLPYVSIGFQYNESEQKSDTILNGENVENEIRGMLVSGFVSPIATIKEVREAMVRQQQHMGKEKGIVMDGRDIGTVVFPNAELKIFVTALPNVRAKRRYDELAQKGQLVSFEEILKNVEERDQIDTTRAESPLKMADDAIVLDNSFLTREEQLQWVLEKVKLLTDEN